MKVATIFVLSAFILLLSICGINNNAAASVATATEVMVTEKEMEIQLSPVTAPAGLVEFVVSNQGQLPHEMEIIKTDLPFAQLPLKGDRLDTKKAGQEFAEIEEDELTSGATKSIQINLTPGRYLIECNLPGHFQAGMKAQFIVQ